MTITDATTATKREIDRLTAERDQAAELDMPVLAGQLDRQLAELAIRTFGGAA